MSKLSTSKACNVSWGGNDAPYGRVKSFSKLSIQKNAILTVFP
jgi:hypothetical protein